MIMVLFCAITMLIGTLMGIVIGAHLASGRFVRRTAPAVSELTATVTALHEEISQIQQTVTVAPAPRAVAANSPAMVAVPTGHLQAGSLPAPNGFVLVPVNHIGSSATLPEIGE